MSVAKCETGWGDGLSTRALLKVRDRHPTPPLISFASTHERASLVSDPPGEGKENALLTHSPD